MNLLLVELDWSVDLPDSTVSILQPLPYSDIITPKTSYRPAAYTRQST